MDSFTLVTDKIKSLLELDSDLKSYCASKFGGSAIVKKAYKKRIEIGLDQLPVILITRPMIQQQQETNIPSYERTHTIRLYCGFHQPDEELAQDQVIGFEEYIDQAILKDDRTLGNLVDHIWPGDSMNDEGYFHPVYFIVKEFLVLREEVYT